MSLPTLLSTNRLVRITNEHQLLEQWPFFLRGMHELNDPRRARAGYSAESFFCELVKIVQLGRHGLVCVLTSKNGKPLGFGAGFTAEDFHGDQCFYVWQAYSNSKCRTALSELQSACDEYARAIGHKVVKTATPRLTQSAVRLFTDVLGYSQEFFTFKKTLTT